MNEVKVLRWDAKKSMWYNQLTAVAKKPPQVFGSLTNVLYS